VGLDGVAFARCAVDRRVENTAVEGQLREGWSNEQFRLTNGLTHRIGGYNRIDAAIRILRVDLSIAGCSGAGDKPAIEAPLIGDGLCAGSCGRESRIA